MIIGAGGIIGFNLGLYQIGKWSVRKEAKVSIAKLKDTIEQLEQSKSNHNEIIKEAEDKIKEIEVHFLY